MRPRLGQAMLLLAALVVPCAVPASVEAQVLVVAEQNLDFGMLTPGMPVSIVPTDMASSAQLRIGGRGTFQVSFQLPDALTSAGGARIPLVFGSTDGRVAIRHKITTFDPTGSLSIRINPAEREAQVNLGGSVQPAPAQPAGHYTATIVMMVVQTGT